MNTQAINPSVENQAPVSLKNKTARTFAEIEAHAAFREGFPQIMAPRSHYKFLMRLGRVIPSDKAQAKYFLSEGLCLDMFTGVDARYIHEMMKEQGLEALFVFTKNKQFIRLVNDYDFRSALKSKYGL